jgi:ParB/RepB/Spo0J family partition protein
MEQIEYTELDPTDLEIDPVNERVSNVNPHSEEGESLENSVRRHGVIQPVVVRPRDGGYSVVAGQRRTLAAQSVGLDSIPVRIVEMDDSEARMVSIIENAEQLKKDVPAGDRAASIKQLVEDGYTISRIANEMGFTKQTIRRWLEPAQRYWEDTRFEASQSDIRQPDPGLDDISLEALQVIRKNTRKKKRRERIAEKVVEANVSNRLVREAVGRSNTPSEFENEIDQIIEGLESDSSRIREEVYFSGSEAAALEAVMKNRGVNEKVAIEMLVQERLKQLDKEENGRWMHFYVDEDISKSISDIIGDRDLPPRAVAKALIKNKLEEHGYLGD